MIPATKDLHTLICSVLEMSSSAEIAEKFNKAQLESVIEHYSSKRQILIDQKDNSSDGYEIERLNSELSAVRIETTKINKAIAVINARPKSKKTPQSGQQGNGQKDGIKIPTLAPTRTQQVILDKLAQCKTIPDIQHTLELNELEIARAYYKDLHQIIVDAKDQNTEQTKIKLFNFELQRINKTLSRVNKAITFAQKDLALQNMSPQAFTIENEFSFLKSFYELAQSNMNDELFADLKQQAVDDYATRYKQNS